MMNIRKHKWTIAMVLIVCLASLPAMAEGETPDAIGKIEAKVGEYITFGHYEQDNKQENGPEPIEWLVMDIQDGRAFVISRYALEYMQYHRTVSVDASVTWETWDLRAWLNNEFMAAAFMEEEQARIPTVTVPAHEARGFEGNPGNDTQDQVFLLSSAEVEKYLPLEVGYEKVWELEKAHIQLEKDERWDILTEGSNAKCQATAYAAASAEARLGHAIDVGIGFTQKDDVNCWWWLRSPGEFDGSAGMIGPNGASFGIGYYSLSKGKTYEDIAVRPAMWVELEP